MPEENHKIIAGLENMTSEERPKKLVMFSMKLDRVNLEVNKRYL